MLEAVAFEHARPGEAQVFLEVGNRAHGFAVAGVALRLRRDEAGRTVLARIAMIGAGETARRIATEEAALLERRSTTTPSPRRSRARGPRSTRRATCMPTPITAAMCWASCWSAASASS